MVFKTPSSSSEGALGVFQNLQVIRVQMQQLDVRAAGLSLGNDAAPVLATTARP